MLSTVGSFCHPDFLFPTLSTFTISPSLTIIPYHLFSLSFLFSLISFQSPIHAYAISLASDPSLRKTAALTLNNRHVNSRWETATADHFVFLFKAVASRAGW